MPADPAKTLYYVAFVPGRGRRGRGHQTGGLTMPTDAKPVHHLSRLERAELERVNELLTRLTVGHHHCCPCELCEARALTDTQDEAAYHVPYEPMEGVTDAG